MNKDEIIEEMAKVLCDNDKRCEECISRLLLPCGYKSYCTKLYNAGYRKVAEDEIVIKKSDYEALLLEQKRLKEIVDRIPCGYKLIGNEEVVISKHLYEQLKKHNADRKRLRLKWQQAKQALEQERKSCRLIADDEIVESMKTYERARQETARKILQRFYNRAKSNKNDFADVNSYEIELMAEEFGIELE